MRNESDYVAEWVAYYKLIGVDSIIIYDNGGNGEVLAKMAELGVVTVIAWPSIEGVSPQISAYQDAVARLIGNTEFAGFFDADEFLVIKPPNTLLSWLGGLGSEISAIAVNQRVFGSGGQLAHNTGLVTQRFVRCCLENHNECRWFKTICRPERTITPPTPHRSIVIEGRYAMPNGHEAFSDCTGYVDENGMVVQTDVVDFSFLQLNHYMLKSKEEFDKKRLRGGVLQPERTLRLQRYADRAAYFDKRDEYCNLAVDMSLALISEDVKGLAECMGFDALIRYHTSWPNVDSHSLFDETYYLARYPDVAAAQIDPWLHYDQFGWKERRDPSPRFSTTKYLETHVDVRLACVNPLSHFLQNGAQEGRKIFDADW